MLEALTGLPAKRLREIIRERRLPAPVGGQYETAPILKGLFAFFQEASAKAEIRDQYESIAHCSGATGIPEATIKMAKRAGCSAFVGARVRLAPLLQWIFSQAATDDGVDWGNEFKKESAKLTKVRRQRAEREVIPRKDVERCLATASAWLRQSMQRQDNAELPSSLFALDKIQIQKLLVSAHDHLWVAFQKHLESLAAPDPTDPPAA